MSLIPKVIEKKAKSVGPVIVEGKMIRRTEYDINLAKVWLDRKIGDGARALVMPHFSVVKNQIMFFPYSHQVSCNPKYISDELIREAALNGYDFDMYWSQNKAQFATMDADDIYAKLTPDGIINRHDPRYHKIEIFIEKHVHFVRPNSYDYFQAAGSSRVLLTNSILGDKFYSFPVKANQIVAETWHGSLGIKRFDLAHYNTNMSWPVAAQWTGSVTTHCISNSTFEDGVFRETFWEKTPILRLGHARNDIFFDNYRGMQTYLRNAFIKANDLKGDEHFVIYAPTFRDDHDFRVYDLDPEPVLKALEKRFGGRWKLLLRFHDNDRKTGSWKRNSIKGPDVINVTMYPDIQELLAFCDAAITDYSSWIYDFMLTKKPGFLFAMDKKKYNDERGFYFRLEDTPFPVSTNTEELAASILSFDADGTYKDKVESFLEGKGCMDDGHASERIAAQCLDWMGITH